ncbi:MAG TPA: MOSC domain-containing protein [Gemmatimonadaceae bacterium]|jgi:MOSC domain-containing protein YiiM
MTDEQGVIVSINVSRGGVPKLPVQSARISAGGLEGDGQRDLRHHGGPDRAVCLYAIERIESLRHEGHPVAPGTTGENLTIRGLDWDAIIPGARLLVGDVMIEITGYASPCTSIRPSFADADSTRISQKVHPGWSRVYGRVLGEGELNCGDAVRLSVPG